MAKKNEKKPATNYEIESLQEVLKKLNLKSKEELDTIAQNLIQLSTKSSKIKLTNKDKAKDLVYQAYELDFSKAYKNVIKALKLDNECLEAYEFLGKTEKEPEIAACFYEKAIAIGRKFFGGKYLIENRGYFWGLTETRTFMRSLFMQSNCLYAMGKVNEAIEILKEIIDLNPGDNMGARYYLMLYLIETNKLKDYSKYDKLFDEEDSTIMLFNKVLYTFKKEGNSEKTKTVLKEAVHSNKFVVKKLLSSKTKVEQPGFYGIGDESEAIYYVSFAFNSWKKTIGALEWLKKQSEII